jgi:hypothetical protein
MGEAPMAIRHIAADLLALGIETEPWELRLLRQASNDYAVQRQLSRKRDCPAPYEGPEREDESEPVEEAFVEAKVSRQVSGLFAQARAHLAAVAADKAARAPKKVKPKHRLEKAAVKR